MKDKLEKQKEILFLNRLLLGDLDKQTRNNIRLRIKELISEIIKK